MSGTVGFSGRTVTVGGRSWNAEYPIQEAVLSGDTVVVLYDRESFRAKLFRTGQFTNVAGYSLDGVKKWTAEHPSNETADVYVNIMSASPLKLWNFTCFVCELDPSTGRLLHAEFTK